MKSINGTKYNTVGDLIGILTKYKTDTPITLIEKSGTSYIRIKIKQYTTSFFKCNGKVVILEGK